MPYPASTLTFLATKKKWYVSVTIPPDLRDAFGGKVQVKRSTGTSDKRDAQRKMHSIAASIYESFDKAKPDPFVVAARELLAISPAPGTGDVEYEIYHILAESGLQEAADTSTKETAIAALKEIARRSRWEDTVKLEDGTYGVLNQRRKAELLEQLEGVVSPSAGQSFLSVANDFVTTTNFTRQATKKQAETVIKEFADFIGDLALHEVTAVTLHSYAEHLSDAGMAYNTIRGRVDKVSLVFHYAVRKGLVPSNPCLGLKLQGYGKQRENYTPLTVDEEKFLFALPMPPQHKLLLQMLAMTGARLDEIALLTWDEIEEVLLADGSKASFINLTKRPSLIKNRGSLRRIPLHPAIKLPPRGEPQERLFPSFTTNKDGKTIWASEVLMGYIRKVTPDKLKVVHSLRGGFKDKLRDAGISKEVNDFITGHGSGDVAGKYGAGPSLSVRFEAISRLPVLW